MAVSNSLSSLLPVDAGVYKATASLTGDGAIDGASSTVTGDRTSGIWSSKENGLQKDDFLQLLVMQLKYQDPLSPMDNQQFLDQLTQLRAIEGTNNIQTAIEGLKDAFGGTVDAQKYSAQSVSNASAVSLIGKQVRLRSTDVFARGTAGENIPIQVHLGNAQSAEVRLLDSDGNVVKTFVATGKDAENSVTLNWDGVGDNGKHVQAGTLAVQIQGSDTDPGLYAFVQDQVQGVRFSSEGALIKVGGRELSVGNVMDVSIGDGAQGTGSLSSQSAIELLGKQVRMRQISMYFGARAGEDVSMQVSTGDNSKVTARIYDSTGELVRSITVPAQNGEATLVWDGRKMDGSTFVKAGSYRVEFDEAADNPSVYGYVDGTVDGISTADGATKLRMDGKLLALGDIIDIAPARTQGGAV